MYRIGHYNQAKSESGQALVEFALILPIVVLLLFGIVEFGRIFHSYLVVTSSAREGARKAAVTQNIAAIEAVIASASASLGGVSVVPKPLSTVTDATPPNTNEVWYNITYPSNGGVRRLGDPVEVYLKARLDLVVPLISDIIGGVQVIRGSAVMNIEF